MRLTEQVEIIFPHPAAASEFSFIGRTSGLDDEGAHPIRCSTAANPQERLGCSIGHVCRGTRPGAVFRLDRRAKATVRRKLLGAKIYAEKGQKRLVQEECCARGAANIGR